MKKPITICLIPLLGPVIYFFIVHKKLKKKGLVSNKKAFGYFLVMIYLALVAVDFSMAICVISNIRFGYDLISYIISVLLIWISMMSVVIRYSRKFARKGS